jgi:predicted secreted hydrolase
MLSRRHVVLALLAARASTTVTSAEAADDAAALVFPRDFGAHPQSRIEWWYITGRLTATARTWGFQVTFFRTLTGIAGADASAFRAADLVFAHAAVTDLERGRLLHDQRLARSGFGIAAAATDDTALVLRDWRLERSGGSGEASRYRTRAASETAGFRFELELATTQPVLLQGARGISRKGPAATQFSRYYSQPQLRATGRLALGGGEPIAVTGTAWLDHEWSDELLAADAVGWDWIGMNLDDGGALMAFRLRRRDGSALWAGGSHRPAGGAVRDFAPSEVVFAAGRRWTSPASKASYPVEWTVTTPVGVFTVEALQDDQELDSRASTGSIYWEGLSRLRDRSGAVAGSGYLEMTGYAGRLRI